MQENPSENSIVPLLLVIANIVGIFIGYAITIVLARSLSHDGFERYIGAVATLSLFASLAEGGFGKYGIKVLPVYIAKENTSLLAGYLRFALIGSLITSLLLGLIAAGIEAPMRAGDEETVILLALLFLPAMAGVGVAVDLLMAFRMAASATLIARILVPLTTLALIGINVVFAEITPLRAILSFAIGSLTGLVLSALLCWLKSRRLIAGVVATTNVREWIGGGLSFFAFGFLTAWIFRASLVLTHHLPHGHDELAMLAPAFETGCLILLLSKSTDKYFQPSISVVLDSSDWELGMVVRRKRLILVGCGVAFFLSIIFMFGKPILGLYGPDFEMAYAALCWIAIGSCIWTLFSLAPSFLLFSGERKPLLLALLSHGLLLAVLTIGLLPMFGATGAAAAYAISISSLASVNAVLANRRLRELKVSAAN